jgi:chitin synthase
MNALRKFVNFSRKSRAPAALDMKALSPDAFGMQISSDYTYIPIKKFGSRLAAEFPGIQALERQGGSEILLCMTAYNEQSHAMLVSLYSHACNMLKYHQTELRNQAQEITLCIMSDGRKPMSRSMALLAEQLGMYHPESLDQNADMHVFEAYLSSHQIGYAMQFSNDLNLINKNWLRVYKESHGSGYHQKADDLLAQADIKFKVLFCVKEKNAGKLDTHWWFFEAFCRHFNPKYCLQMDIGTAPQKDSIFRLWKTMETNPRVGGVASRVRLIPPARFWHFLQGWQFMDF